MLAAAVAAVLLVSVLQVARAAVSTSDTLDDFLAHPKYNVSFASLPESPSTVARGVPPENVFRAHDGTEYYCPALETDAKPADGGSGAAETGAGPKADVVSETELRSRALELTSRLAAGCLSTQIGFWSYEYCHRRHVMQYHTPEQTKLTYKLGRWVSATDAAPEIGWADGRRFLRLRYTMGTMCDVTMAPRMVEAQLYCNNDQTRIVGVKETSVCHYQIEVEVGALCKDPLFKTVDAKYTPRALECYPVGPSRAPLLMAEPPPPPRTFPSTVTSESGTLESLFGREIAVEILQKMATVQKGKQDAPQIVYIGPTTFDQPGTGTKKKNPPKDENDNDKRPEL